jgi:hypothetical protein
MGWSSDWVVIGWTGDQTGPSKKKQVGPGYGNCCARCLWRKKGRGEGKEKKKEGNRNLENFPNQKFMGISKIIHKELVQKSILYKWKK